MNVSFFFVATQRYYFFLKVIASCTTFFIAMATNRHSFNAKTAPNACDMTKSEAR